MTCLRPDLMDLYLGGELEEAERREFEAHLHLCPACRGALEDRRAFDRAVSSLPPIEVPPDFAAAVMARLPAERRHAFRRLAALLAGTAAVLAALLGYHLATGVSLSGIVIAVGRAVAAFAARALVLAAKVIGLLGIILDAAANLARAVWKGLGFLSAFLRPEVVGLILVLASALSLLAVFGVKKIASQGERS